jgi:hypothetical protein
MYKTDHYKMGPFFKQLQHWDIHYVLCKVLRWEIHHQNTN